jgi:hypothetical protein
MLDYATSNEAFNSLLAKLASGGDAQAGEGLRCGS